MEGDIHGNVGEPEPSMLEMLRVIMAEQRRADIAREDVKRAEDEKKAIEIRRADLAREDARREEEERKEEVRLRREVDMAKEKEALQVAAEERQFAQQVAILKLQAELGEKASLNYREGQSTDRKRDRALFSIPVYKEGEDIECFLTTAERRLRAAEIPQREWIPLLESRLSGTKASISL